MKPEVTINGEKGTQIDLSGGIHVFHAESLAKPPSPKANWLARLARFLQELLKRIVDECRR